MKRMLILFVLFFSCQIFSQTEIKPDVLFSKAKEFIFSSQRQQASEICKQIIDVDPAYWDAHVLLGRINAWDKKFHQSREIFKDVISKIQYADAYDGLLDVEIWSGNFKEAIIVADSGLTYYPQNTNFLLKKAKALYGLKEYNEAALALNKLLSIDNKNRGALDLLDKTKIQTIKNQIGITNGIDVFSDIYKNRYLSSLEYKKSTKYGSFIPRINIANRFEKTGGQYEIDVYPKLKKPFSLYLNYGYSNSDLFPEHRIGAELYRGIEKGYEVSLGFRNLFLSDESILIYTGSFSKYYGDYVFSIRPFIAPKSNGTATSINVSAKKHLNDNLDYFMADFSAGSSPDNKQLFLSSDQNDMAYFESQQINLSYTKTFKLLYQYKLGCTVQRMEVPFNPRAYIYMFGVDLGLMRKL